MTPEEVLAWKAEQQKRPLAERLSEIPGYHAETKPERADSIQLEPSASISFDDAKKLEEGANE
jgi:hypothetical protein